MSVLLTQVILSSLLYICSRWTQVKFNVDWINEQNYWFHCYCSESQNSSNFLTVHPILILSKMIHRKGLRNSLAVQRTGLQAPKAEGTGLRVGLETKILHDAWKKKKKEKEKKRAQYHFCSILHKTIESYLIMRKHRQTAFERATKSLISVLLKCQGHKTHTQKKIKSSKGWRTVTD